MEDKLLAVDEDTSSQSPRAIAPVPSLSTMTPSSPADSPTMPSKVFVKTNRKSHGSLGCIRVSRSPLLSPSASLTPVKEGHGGLNLPVLNLPHRRQVLPSPAPLVTSSPVTAATTTCSLPSGSRPMVLTTVVVSSPTSAPLGLTPPPCTPLPPLPSPTEPESSESFEGCNGSTGELFVQEEDKKKKKKVATDESKEDEKSTEAASTLFTPKEEGAEEQIQAKLMQNETLEEDVERQTTLPSLNKKTKRPLTLGKLTVCHLASLGLLLVALALTGLLLALYLPECSLLGCKRTAVYDQLIALLPNQTKTDSNTIHMSMTSQTFQSYPRVQSIVEFLLDTAQEANVRELDWQSPFQPPHFPSIRSQTVFFRRQSDGQDEEVKKEQEGETLNNPTAALNNWWPLGPPLCGRLATPWVLGFVPNDNKWLDGSSKVVAPRSEGVSISDWTNTERSKSASSSSSTVFTGDKQRLALCCWEWGTTTLADRVLKHQVHVRWLCESQPQQPQAGGRWMGWPHALTRHVQPRGGRTLVHVASHAMLQQQDSEKDQGEVVIWSDDVAVEARLLPLSVLLQSPPAPRSSSNATTSRWMFPQSHVSVWMPLEASLVQTVKDLPETTLLGLYVGLTDYTTDRFLPNPFYASQSSFHSLPSSTLSSNSTVMGDDRWWFQFESIPQRKVWVTSPGQSWSAAVEFRGSCPVKMERRQLARPRLTYCVEPSARFEIRPFGPRAQEQQRLFASSSFPSALPVRVFGFHLDASEDAFGATKNWIPVVIHLEFGGTSTAAAPLRLFLLTAGSETSSSSSSSNSPSSPSRSSSLSSWNGQDDVEEEEEEADQKVQAGTWQPLLLRPRSLDSNSTSPQGRQQVLVALPSRRTGAVLLAVEQSMLSSWVNVSVVVSTVGVLSDLCKTQRFNIQQLLSMDEAALVNQTHSLPTLTENEIRKTDRQKQKEKERAEESEKKEWAQRQVQFHAQLKKWLLAQVDQLQSVASTNSSWMMMSTSSPFVGSTDSWLEKEASQLGLAWLNAAVQDPHLTGASVTAFQLPPGQHEGPLPATLKGFFGTYEEPRVNDALLHAFQLQFQPYFLEWLNHPLNTVKSSVFRRYQHRFQTTQAEEWPALVNAMCADLESTGVVAWLRTEVDPVVGRLTTNFTTVMRSYFGPNGLVQTTFMSPIFSQWHRFLRTQTQPAWFRRKSVTIPSLLDDQLSPLDIVLLMAVDQWLSSPQSPLTWTLQSPEQDGSSTSAPVNAVDVLLGSVDPPLNNSVLCRPSRVLSQPTWTCWPVGEARLLFQRQGQGALVSLLSGCLSLAPPPQWTPSEIDPSRQLGYRPGFLAAGFNAFTYDQQAMRLKKQVRSGWFTWSLLRAIRSFSSFRSGDDVRLSIQLRVLMMVLSNLQFNRPSGRQVNGRELREWLCLEYVQLNPEQQGVQKTLADCVRDL